MSAETAGTINANTVLACMRSRRVEAHFATLVAVGGVDRPSGLVPSLFEAFAHLADDGQGCQRGEGEKCGFRKHDCCCWIGACCLVVRVRRRDSDRARPDEDEGIY